MAKVSSYLLSQITGWWVLFFETEQSHKFSFLDDWVRVLMLVFTFLVNSSLQIILEVTISLIHVFKNIFKVIEYSFRSMIMTFHLMHFIYMYKMWFLTVKAFDSSWIESNTSCFAHFWFLVCTTIMQYYRE